MLDLKQEALCAYGCPNKREAREICCPACWKLVPRALKREFWDATKAASFGRGVRKNGRATPRLKSAIRSIVEVLIEKVSKPYQLAQTEERRKNGLQPEASATGQGSDT